MPLSASQIVVFVISIFGYKWVHYYEREMPLSPSFARTRR